MLVIRLRRIGKKNKPTYRVVVAEHSFPVDGKFTADLGFYNPHTKAIGLDKEAAIDWMKKGAQPSNTVARLLEKEKVKHASVVVVKRNKKTKSEPKEAAAPAPAEKADETPEPTEETPAATEEVSPEPAESEAEAAAETTESN